MGMLFRLSFHLVMSSKLPIHGFDQGEIGRNLAQANTHVEKGSQVLKRQIALIERFKYNQQFTEIAEDLLATFMCIYVSLHGRRDGLANRLSKLDLS
jgi:hypothetical protein